MNSWILLGGGAAVGLFASGWSYVRSVWGYLSSFMVVMFEAHGLVAEAVLCYCASHSKRPKHGPRMFTGWRMFVRPRRRIEAVALETIGKRPQFVFIGRRPLWIGRTSASDSPNDTTGSVYRPITVSYIRGMFDTDNLVEIAMRHYNGKAALDKTDRHRGRHVSGTAGKSVMQQPGEISVTSDESDLRQYRIVSLSPNDIGPAKPKRTAIDSFAMSDEVLELADDLLDWSQQREWFVERDIPWRMGVLLHGEIGRAHV